MKTILTRLFIFSLPFWLYLLLVGIIDPFNYLSSDNFIENELKTEISYKSHYPLWKLNNFKNDPNSNILLGDSRTNSLSTDTIYSATGLKFTNLAYGGGTLREIIATFWEANKQVKLSKVYIGINFNLYNSYNNNDRVLEALSLTNNFFIYGLNRYVFKATFNILRAKLFNTKFDLETPDMNKDEFWSYQLDVTINSFYEQYAYPKEYFKELKEIAQYCKKNEIELFFFIPPTHVDLQNKVEEHNLLEEYAQFINDLNLLGKTYRFNNSSQLTQDKANFKDPFHLNDNLLNDVFKETILNDISNEH